MSSDEESLALTCEMKWDRCVVASPHATRRISGRLAAKAFDGRAEAARKKLDYGVEAKTPKAAVNGKTEAKTPKVNGSILKHKRRSQGKRRSSSRVSMSKTHSATSAENRDPTTYTVFKDKKKISRSSMASQQVQVIVHPASDDGQTPNVTPKTTPRKAPMTPKVGKENMHHQPGVTPKSNLMYTPNRLTRSAMKLDHEGFATPRAPLSAEQNTLSVMAVKTPPVTINRRGLGPMSKSHTHLVRAKNLPPLI